MAVRARSEYVDASHVTAFIVRDLLGSVADNGMYYVHSRENLGLVKSIRLAKSVSAACSFQNTDSDAPLLLFGTEEGSLEFTFYTDWQTWVTWG